MNKKQSVDRSAVDTSMSGNESACIISIFGGGLSFAQNSTELFQHAWLRLKQGKILQHISKIMLYPLKTFSLA